MTFDDLPLWKRALLLNAASVVGIAVGLASTEATLVQYGVRAGVFFLAFVNFMFFVLRPHLLTERRNQTRGSVMGVFLRVVREQPLIFAVAVLLLDGASRSAAAVVVFAQSSSSAYVRGLPNASTAAPRMVLMSFVMAGTSLLWLSGAVGIWARRTWAWWLSLILNGLAAGISVILQLFNWRTYLLDPFATAAVVLLLLPQVRKSFRRAERTTQPA